MLFFLTCISVVLIATGGAAAFYGADTIRSESGATIAVAGVSVACAGFLLLGLVQVCLEVRRLRRATEALNEAPHADVALPPLPSPAAGEKSDLTARPADSAAGARIEPTVSDTAPVRTEPPVGTYAGVHAPRSAADRDSGADLQADAEATIDSDLLAAEEGKSPEPAPSAPAPTEPVKERGEPVATYTSGGNTYFMYGDGTIEADTPRGRFRFTTMSELRHYAETGEGGLLLKAAADDPPADLTARRAESITI